MPTIYMLIGVPGSGKTTWAMKHMNPGTIIASSDDYIQRQADSLRSTYSEVFDKYIKEANRHLIETTNKAFSEGLDLIWDQTNVSKNSRQNKLKSVPDNYIKVAVFFQSPPIDILKVRLASRPGKNIPLFVIANMIRSLEEPTAEEGFQEIITIV